MTGPTGWWPDPSGRHPFRYFVDGQPTEWVRDLPVDAVVLSSVTPSLLPPAMVRAGAQRGPVQHGAAGGTGTVGWYRRVNDPTEYRYWDGRRWTTPIAAPQLVTSGPAVEQPRSRTARRRRPRSMITIAEALAVVMTLTAVITFAFKATGHTAARTEAPAPTSTAVTTTTNAPPTTLPAPTAPASLGTQVAQWWAGAGGPKSSALTADLESMQSDGGDTAQLAVHCSTFTTDASAANSVGPAPSPAIEREWQLTLSTSQRVVAACAAQKFTQVGTDLEPALYTIRDLTHQVDPYLSGRVP